ncbi:MAG: adenylosuccinate lyase [Bacteroidota bacterium]
MITRYTRPEMGKIWSDENRFKIWLEIEILACEARASLGEIPKNIPNEIRKKAKFNTERINEIEIEVKHDVIAFLTNVSESLGAESRYIHYGMTSSDVLDTSLSVQMLQSSNLLLKDLNRLKNILSNRAKEFKNTVMIGRTHGVHAEPTTFGLKLALWFDETRRNLKRLQQSREMIAVGKISGAVGTFEHLSPKVEEYVCEKLNLKSAPVSTQIIQRDRHADFLSTLAIIGSSLEKFATEIRHLQKTEVLEAEEYFSKGQKGSSAMPHKRNPITCERIAGLARVLRANAMASMENISLWHERDITHSSVERIIIPDSCILLNYMLHLANDLLENLIVYPENMKKNLNTTLGLVYSQKVLLALTLKGLAREESYKIVQTSAMKCWNSKIDFRKLLEQDKKIKKIFTKKELDAIFNPKNSLKQVDYIFKRVNLN